jgi:hypothetical protein
MRLISLRGKILQPGSEARKHGDSAGFQARAINGRGETG